jgi:hypothetical protein
MQTSLLSVLGKTGRRCEKPSVVVCLAIEETSMEAADAGPTIWPASVLPDTFPDDLVQAMSELRKHLLKASPWP